MPYAGPDDPTLPAHVLALPAARRRQWVAVWRAAMDNCGQHAPADHCEHLAMAKANGVVKKALSEAGDPVAASMPGSSDVHVPGLLGQRDEEKSARPGRPFLARLRDLLREKFRDAGLTDEVYAECVGKARGHAGGMARAEKRRAATLGEGATNLAAPVALAEGGHTSCIVALWLAPYDAETLAVAGGEAAEDLHLTLVHLGESTPDLAARVRTVVGDFANEASPLLGRVAGLGRFYAAERTGGKDCLHALIDSPDLPTFRQALVAALDEAGIAVSRDYGFVPHVTLAYVAPGAADPEARPQLEVLFSTIWVCAGDERTAFYLMGATDPEIAEAEAYGEGRARLGWIRLGEQAEEVDARDRETARLFLETPEQFAEPPDWVPYLPKPGTYKHPRYTDEEMTFTPERTARFISHFNAGLYQKRLPIDAEHESKLSGALGWIVAMRQNADGSADARVEWTDRGQSLIEADRFKYFSPEFYTSWREPASGQVYQDVAIGGALTTRPFFKEGSLRPLVASEQQPERPEGGAGSVGSAPAGTSPVTGDGGTIMGTVTLTEEQAKQFAAQSTQLAEMKSALEAQSKALTEATAAAEQARADATAASERLAAQEKVAQRKAFTDEVMGRSEANHLRWFGEPGPHVAMLERLTEAFGADSEPVRAYITQQRAVSEALRASDFSTEKGRRGSDGESATGGVEAEIERRATALREHDPNLTDAQAFARVIETNPQLQARYFSEQRGR